MKIVTVLRKIIAHRVYKIILLTELLHYLIIILALVWILFTMIKLKLFVCNVHNIALNA